MELDFSGEVIYWRGPAPWHFVAVPDDGSAEIEAVSRQASYGWGCIQVTATSGETTWTTALIPKDGRYLVPVKTAVRLAEEIELGDVIDMTIAIDL